MRKGLTLLILLSPLLSLVPQQAQRAKLTSLVLAHVTVIDATGAPARPDMTVVIVGNHIAELGKAGEIRSPENAQTVNGAGKFLIP